MHNCTFKNYIQNLHARFPQNQKEEFSGLGRFGIEAKSNNLSTSVHLYKDTCSAEKHVLMITNWREKNSKIMEHDSMFVC